MNQENVGELRYLLDALTEIIHDCGYTFSSSETIIGYVHLKSSKIAQVTLKVNADKNEWIAD